MISLILAIGKNKLVGNTKTSNGLPWHYPEDLAFYKAKTTGKINVMGKTTYDMIGYALPNRTTIVLSRDQELVLNDAEVVNDPQIIIDRYLDCEDEIMICGGVAIFKLFIDYADKIYLTLVNQDYEGDKYYDLDVTNFKVEDKLESGDLVFYTLIRK